MNWTRILTAALLVVLATGAALAADKTFERTIKASPGGTLSVSTDMGSVGVRGTEGSEVVIKARMEGRERDLEEFVIEAKETAGGVEVTGRVPKGFWRALRGTHMSVTFEIQVPRRYNVRLETAGGDVTVADLTGEVTGETSGGTVTVRKIEGKARLETSGGDIRIDGVKGDVTGETSGGDIKAAAVVGGVRVETSGGNIGLDNIDGKVFAETSGGNITIVVKGANRGIHAETSGGNITVSIGKSVGAMLDAGTSGGDVECDIPVAVSGKISESRIRGTVNGGGEVIYAHTSGGNVRIRATE